MGTKRDQAKDQIDERREVACVWKVARNLKQNKVHWVYNEEVERRFLN